MNLSQMRQHALTDTVDAVVIGTGAGGAPLLARLAAAGLRVVALEAGRNHTPETFTADEIAAAELYWLGERLSGGMPEAFGANNSGIGVGGSTLHWGAFVPRPREADWRLRSLSGEGEDWPFRVEELAPYLQEVERFIGVSGPADYPWDPSQRYPLPPPPLNAPAQLMQAGCTALGMRHCAAPAAVVSRPYAQPGIPDRPACINCGYCHQGCRTGAKTSMDVTYLPLAVARGAEIRPDCFAHGLERDARGRITAVVYRHQGKDLRQRCNAVFLCAGAVETPRLLLHTGLGNSSGQVGRNYMAHVATQVWGSFAQETRPNKGYPSSLITEDMGPEPRDFAGRYLTQSLGIVPVTWAGQVARGRGMWGQTLVDYLDGYNHVAGIGINGDCLPQDSNRLTLSGEVDDATGVAKPLIEFNYSANEHAMSVHAAALLTDIWTAAGATDIWTFERAAHTIGTCRMGTDAAQAVVNDHGRSFDIDNLWICDNSVFPSAMAANPALTIMALSLRTADAFMGRAA